MLSLFIPTFNIEEIVIFLSDSVISSILGNVTMTKPPPIKFKIPIAKNGAANPPGHWKTKAPSAGPKIIIKI